MPRVGTLGGGKGWPTWERGRSDCRVICQRLNVLPGAQTLGLQCHMKCPAGRCCSVPRDVLRASSVALFVQVLPSCLQGTVVLETAVLPQAVAGQGEVGDGKGWETVKDILPFLVKVHGWGEGGCLWWPGELFMYLLYSDLRFVFSHFSLRANVFLIKYCEGITCSFS